ncbi:MAG: class I SAM-dependent methyltransferase [Alphaproteobacteria bacterium]|nr:class I SAM-dependent methyltransferase [Alphaproteobacteria bacterium]
MGTSIGLDEALQAYLARMNREEHPVLARCRTETRAEMGGRAIMQISPEQGAVLAFLVRLIGARTGVEVGVFTGYSALAVALALKDMHGTAARLHACDLDADYLARAGGYWRSAGVSEIMEPHAGPAAESLEALIAEGAAGTLDYAFVDADKAGYPLYYERCLTLLRPGGLLIFDNVLWSGTVADPSREDETIRVLRTLTATARADDRLDMALAAIGDGLLLCRKR